MQLELHIVCGILDKPSNNFCILTYFSSIRGKNIWWWCHTLCMFECRNLLVSVSPHCSFSTTWGVHIPKFVWTFRAHLSFVTLLFHTISNSNMDDARLCDVEVDDANSTLLYGCLCVTRRRQRSGLLSSWGNTQRSIVVQENRSGCEFSACKIIGCQLGFN